MKPCPPTEYSVCVAGNCCAVDPSRRAPGSRPDSVAWFNRLISDLQFHALWPIVKSTRVSVGIRIVYAGRATSRRLHRSQKLRFRTMYIDATHVMFHSMLERRTGAARLGEEASRFLVRGPAYDSVSDTAPTQDVLASLEGFAEMIRVIPARGCLVATGLFRRRHAHLTLRRDWIEQAISSDAKLMAWFSKKRFVIDRLLVRATKTLSVWNEKPAILTFTLQVSSPPSATTARRTCWVLRYITALTSAWADTVSEKIGFGRLAIRGTLVIRI
jgi:hypothetical protein